MSIPICPLNQNDSHLSHMQNILIPSHGFQESDPHITVFAQSPKSSTSKSGQDMSELLQVWFLLICGGQKLSWLSILPASLYSCPCVIALFLSMSKTCNLLLNNKIWQRWWVVINKTAWHDKRLTDWQPCSRDFCLPGCVWRGKRPCWETYVTRYWGQQNNGQLRVAFKQ